MIPSQNKLTITMVLVALLGSNVAVLAQAAKKPAGDKGAGAKQNDGLDLSAPANGSTSDGSAAAPPASIDLSEEFQDASVKPIPDTDRAKQIGDQSIIVTASEATRLNELEAKVHRLEQLIEGQSATLQDIADRLSTPPAELKAIHEELVKLNSKTTVARPDLGGGVSDPAALVNVGKLVVSNYTGMSYTIAVNGRPFVITPGRGELNVQVGPVTTEIIGFEAPKTWAETDWRDIDGQRQLAIQIR